MIIDETLLHNENIMLLLFMYIDNTHHDTRVHVQLATYTLDYDTTDVLRLISAEQTTNSLSILAKCVSFLCLTLHFRGPLKMVYLFLSSRPMILSTCIQTWDICLDISTSFCESCFSL